MSSAVPKAKLLIVDTAPQMAQVLKTYTELNNYESDVFSDSADACTALANRFANPDGSNNYDCMILGWPQGQTEIISDVLSELIGANHSDLPIIVLSETANKDVHIFARKRRNTRTLLWSDYQRIEEVLQSVVINEDSSKLAPVDESNVQKKNQTYLPASILLVDNTPAICQALRRVLESNGYSVANVATAAEARKVLANRNFDLVLTEYFLPEESCESLCQYMRSLSVPKRPVYAVMAERNLDRAVQQGLSAGAITCLDKTESTEVLFARLNAIANGLKSREPVASDINVSMYGGTGHGEDGNATASIEDLVASNSVPSILIDSCQNIIAANKEAAIILSAGDQTVLQQLNFEKTIHGAPVRQSPEEPVKALFRDLNGKTISVAYRSRTINGSEYSISGEICLLTFEAKDQVTPAMTSSVVNHTVNDVEKIDPSLNLHSRESINQPSKQSQAVVQENVQTHVDVGMDAVLGLEPVIGVKAAVKSGSIRAQINKAINNRTPSVAYGLLMLDVKMVAVVTGDRLSLSKSEPLLRMVETELAGCCGPNMSLAYNGDGKFILLYESEQPELVRSNAQKLVRQLPDLVADLTDVELLSYASFVDLPVQAAFTADYILQHCIAACMKAEMDGLDNGLFDINAHGMLEKSDSTQSNTGMSGVSQFRAERPLENQPAVQ